MAAPILSVVIVTHNSRVALPGCLSTLATQEIEHEIIVVDNASRDGLPEWLRERYAGIRVLMLSENRGFGVGANRGIRAATGRYVLVLNPDTAVEPGALQEMLRVAEAHPRSFINPKLLQSDGSINACGNQMHYTGITTCVGLGTDRVRYRGVIQLSLLSGAAILGARSDWLDVGGFDENFFLYMEDADLSLRLRLEGYDLLCAADASITHHYELKMSPRKFGLLERNRLLTVFKSYGGRTLVRLAPALCLTELATWCYALMRGPRYLAARWHGYRWLWRHRQDWRRDRARIQANRRVADSRLIGSMTASLPFEQLIQHRAAARILGRLTTPLYGRAGSWGDSP